MALFWKKKQPAPAPAQEPSTIPSTEDQTQAAKADLEAYFSTILNSWGTDDDDDWSYDYFRVAGITHYCTTRDIGMIRGATFPDKSNPVDKGAIGIMSISDAGKQRLLGYIAKEDKARYKKLAGGAETRIFIGYIRTFEGEDAQGIMGVIKVYGNSNSKSCYEQMIQDTRLLRGVFKGYYRNHWLKDEGERPEWILERFF